MGKRGQRIAPEIKAEAIRLVEEGGLSARSAARQCDVSYQTLLGWLKVRRTSSAAEDEDLRAQVARLQAEVNELRMEKEILKKAAAFFAKESR